MPITFTYDDMGWIGHRLNVTGYSALTYCNFLDLWNADKAGTLELFPTTAAALNLSLNRQIRPSDELALKIDLIVTNYAVNGAVTLTGQDKDGGAQIENITITGNGTYTSTLWFKSVDGAGVDCTGTYDVQVRQNQWGSVWKLSPALYRIEGTWIMLGDATNDAYFGDTRVSVEVYDMSDMACLFDSPPGKGHLYLGNVSSVAEKTGQDGCTFRFYSPSMLMDQMFTRRLAEFYMYDTKVICDYGVATIFGLTGTDGRIWQCDIVKTYLTGIAGNMDVYNLGISDGFLTVYGFSTTGSMAMIRGLNNTYVMWLPQSATPTTIENLYLRDWTGMLVFTASGTTASHHLVDSDLDWSITTFAFHASPLCKIYRDYRFNKTIIDELKAPYAGKAWTLKDKNGVTQYSGVTQADGKLAVIDTIVEHGYFAQSGGNTEYESAPYSLWVDGETDYLDLDEIDLSMDSKNVNGELTMVNVTDIVDGINDIKGTGFVKDTHSLTNIGERTKKLKKLLEAILGHVS